MTPTILHEMLDKLWTQMFDMMALSMSLNVKVMNPEGETAWAQMRLDLALAQDDLPQPKPDDMVFRA